MNENTSLPRDPAVCCLFTGHRRLPKSDGFDALRRKTENAIRAAYDAGFRNFYAGGAVGFDMLAAISVLNLRQKELPGMTLTLVLPHFGHYHKWSKNDQHVFAGILERADETVYLADVYSPGCMQARNRYMVDRCSRCICLCERESGGTAYTVRYARSRGLTVDNLADPE